MTRVVHFELASDHPERAAAFYRDVFGWKIEKWDGPIDYYLITTGNESDMGIDGGLMKSDETFQGVVNTIGVDDIDTYLARAKECGGQVVLEKHAIPGVGYQAYFKDPDGVIVGLHQRDTSAGMA